MCSTRSPSPNAPATKRSAIIVSHGQPSDPDPAEAALARQAPELPGWFVQTATLAKRGSLESALSRAGAAPVIYPMFMTDGWFVRSALRDRLRDVKAPVVLPPLGVDPGLPDVALQALAAELDRQGWSAGETTLLVTAHGSGRSRNSARDTQRFVERLGERAPFAELRIGYVEEPPHLGEAAALCPRQSICLPFFAADGGHVQEDIPQALQATGFAGPCMAPVGLLPGIGRLMARAIAGAPVAGE
ncbi:cobalamin biosynthesis protein CbiX [Roseovarius spongiae]|uniref:Cobalamin biosynthesis protein CbiX n=1 Tax=Roseovarius spongiae TaxID=2320272 RepID=A0A3A8B528_9RHOB|nr:CbiX/SirB N-terminal domain-containing protein [Roseovarius spongiae]RKF17081.1 cobalamin biosynthesis protein CbiX [Roseovarius spongiae]